MWVCHICDKPFAKESTHKRHIPYCHQKQTRSRTRPKACRSCSAAKAKCTFQSPCRRCSTKGIKCVYELTNKTVAVVEDGEFAASNADEQTGMKHPDQPDSLQSYSTSRIDFSLGEDLGAADTFDFTHSNGDMEDVFRELFPHYMNEPLANGYESIQDIATVPESPPPHKPVPFSTSAWPHSFIQPRMGDAAQAPWSAWTTSVVNLPTLSKPNLQEVMDFRRIECLVPPQASSSLIIKQNTHLMVQALRSYPLMMLRRETLPPFIHAHWYRQSTPALPEPLSNCMSIAQMYAFRSEETKPFLWRTIKAEDERLFAQRRDFSLQDLLAAIQAQTIYMIMRFADGTSEPPGLNAQLITTYQFLCKQFRATCGTPEFCEVDQVYPRPSWEEWIFAESRRRTACLFFLIYSCVSVDNGICACDASAGFDQLPIAALKTLWEAKTREDWESEYSAYSNRPEIGMHTMGMLLEAHKQKDDPIQSQLLDYWSGRTDGLGNLLNMAASMAIAN